jgi:Holliday junction resolvase-like predicted endonuclease
MMHLRVAPRESMRLVTRVCAARLTHIGICAGMAMFSWLATTCRCGAKGEIDLIGYDGKTLAFVEVRTRTVREELSALPELSVTTDKQRVVIRTAQRFLVERHVGDCPCRFDVLAIDNRPGLLPEVRLHKDAFSPQM